MHSRRFGPALASLGLAGGLLFSAAFARDVYTGISRPARREVESFASAARRGSAPTEGELLGKMSVPRLSMDSLVFEGVAAATLARGAGHVPGTALPGEEDGASMIAVPRGRSGEAVSRLKLNDRVALRTTRGLLGYRVVARRIVEATRFQAVSAGITRLTLVTAYPADAAGPAPMRLAVSLEPMD
ncbi:MAG TPA: sortase [Thermoanaerobaculia bacterium]|nr:sortase [Thermoanaerobaculia bacterium]